MAAPFQYDFTIYAGQDHEEVFTYKAGTPAVLVDLTGFSARMQIKKTLSSEAAITLTSGNGGIVLGGASGTIAIVLTNAQTSALPIEYGIYDLELVSPGQKVRRFLTGSITVSPEVTTIT